MKNLTIFLFFFSTTLFAGDFEVICKPWDENNKTFSLTMEVEESGGINIDAWVNLKVFEDENQIHSITSTWSYGNLFIHYLQGQSVYIIELIPSGGRNANKYDFLNLAANHPVPTGNSYLIYKGKEYQAECFVQN